MVLYFSIFKFLDNKIEDKRFWWRNPNAYQNFFVQTSSYFLCGISMAISEKIVKTLFINKIKNV